MSIILHPRSTLFISGFLLLMHICNMAQSIEAGFPYFSKVELGYAVIWGIVFIVASIIATVTFKFAVVSIYTSHLSIAICFLPDVCILLHTLTPLRSGAVD